MGGLSAMGFARAALLKIHAVRRATGVAAVIFLGLLILVPFGAGAIAQENLSDQMKRLRQDLDDIQSYLYRSTDVPSSKGMAASSSSNPESLSLLQRQMLEMQTQMRELTGQLEQIDHGMRVMGKRLDKLVGDVDLRLRTLEDGGAMAAPRPVANGSVDPGRAGPAPRTVVSRDDRGTTIISSRTFAGTPRPTGSTVLGTVQQRDVDAVRQGQSAPLAAAPAPRTAFQPAPAPRPAPGPARVTLGGVQPTLSTPSILPEGTIQEQYTFAFRLLRKRDYDTAEIALREFIERHPDVPLAGNAMYWMGETYYVRKDYAEAARIFLDAYQRFPKGNKAADNLFKLAKSLSQIGENESACTTYGKLLKSIPTANARILASARNDMSRLECS
jgi:tol-pal system protein YbgF